MANADFVRQLRELGYQPQEVDTDRIIFPYDVPCGRLAGQQIRLGFVVPADFNLTPPSGPHVSPRLLPINSSAGAHPNCGVHESPTFGADWEYWSRPLGHWAQTKRRVKDVMAHIHHLFDTL